MGSLAISLSCTRAKHESGDLTGNGALSSVASVEALGCELLECRKEILQQNWVYPIGGAIDVYEVVRTFIRLQHTDIAKAVDVFAFADAPKFATVVNGG